jgi:hypothetical protein
MTKCSLCEKESTLEVSHIIPKFITKWLLKTGVGYLRGNRNPNLRLQDGIKKHFLCGNCEDLFEKAETYYANNIFFPVVNNTVETFNYNEKHLYFVISVIWRIYKESIELFDSQMPHYNKIVDAEKKWRNYLLGKSKLENYNTIHLLVGVDLVDKNEAKKHGIILPKRLIQYMARGIDADLSYNNDLCFFYLKFPRFIYIMPFCGISNEKMINSIIYPNGGLFDINQTRIENPIFGNYFLNRAKVSQKIFDELSVNQRQKMNENIEKKWPSTKDTDIRRIANYSQKHYPDLD